MFVDGYLQAFKEQSDMVAVNETVVCREGDVNHPSPVALHIFAATTKWGTSTAKNVPTLGIKCSHAGNKMFPRWE